MVRYMIFSIFTVFSLSACSDAARNTSSQTLFDTMAKHRQNATPQQTDTAYFLLGFHYQNDPTTTGKKVADIYEQLTQKYKLDSEKRSQEFNQFLTQFPILKKPNADGLFCSWKDNQTCIDEVLKQSNQWQTAQQQYPLLQQRYLQFLNMPPAVTPYLFEAHSPLPNYSYLMLGQKLAIFQLFQQAKNGQKDLAREQSLQQLTQLRLHFAQSDLLIDKLVLNTAILQQLQAIVLLKTRYQVDFNQEISPLTDQERDLTLAFYQEFVSQANMFESFKTEHYTLFFKPNDTINHTADFWIKTVDIQKRDIKQFNEFYQQENSKETQYAIPINRFYNYVGHTLANIAPPDYKVYIARLYHTQNIINIVNHILTDGKTPLNNLFQKEIQQNEHSICMDFIDKENDSFQNCIYK